MRHATADTMRHAAIFITNGRWRPIRWQLGIIHAVLLLIVVALASSQAASIVKNDIDANYDSDIDNVTNTLASITSTTTSVTPIDAITLPNDVSAVATTVNFTVTTKTASSTLPVPLTISTTPSTPNEPESNSLSDTLVSSTLPSVPIPVAVPTVGSSTQLPSSSAAPATPIVTKPYRGSTTFKSTTTTNRSAKLVSNDIGQDTSKESDKHIDGPSIVEAQGDKSMKQHIAVVNATTQRDNDADLAAYTTENYHFDLSHYTSEYGSNQNNTIESSSRRFIDSLPSSTNTQRKNNRSEADTSTATTLATLGASLSNIADNQIGNFSAPDYERKFDEIVLTTPKTVLFDKIHKEYEQDKNYVSQIRDSDGIPNDDSRTRLSAMQHNSTKDLQHGDPGNGSSSNLLNTIAGNATAEKNSSRYYNNEDLESTSYDFSANEIHNSTTGVDAVGNSTSEKRGKYLQDPINKTSSGSDVNLTIPSTSEVWSVAAQKKVDHYKVKDGQFYNNTSTLEDNNAVKKPSNGTLVTKQLADWVEVMKHQDFTNTTFGSNAAVNGTLPKIKELITPKHVTPLFGGAHDSASQENQIVVVRLSPTTTETPLANMVNRFDQNRIAEMANDSIVIPVKMASQNLIHKEKNVLDRLTTQPTIEEDETTTYASEDDNTVTQENENDDDETATDDVSTDHHTQEDTDEEDLPATTFQEDVHIPTPVPVETVGTVKHDVVIFPTMSANIVGESDKPTTMLPSTEVITQPITTESSMITTTTQPNESIESNLVVKTSESIQKVGSSTTPKASTSIDTSTVDHITDNSELPEFTTIVIDPDNDHVGGHEEWDVVTTTTASKNGTAIMHKPDVHTGGGSHEEISDEDDEDNDNIMMEPKAIENATDSGSAHLGVIGGGFKSSTPEETDVNAIIAISVSVVGVICVVLLVGFLFVMRKRQKQLTYGQRCRPVGLDAYSLDNVSVYNSVRRKGALRQSKRAYGNAAFDDPALKNNILSSSALSAFVSKRLDIYEEFKELPTVTARVDEVPAGCEDKNRYANIVPLPETRVYLKRINNDEKSEYINANFIKGPKDTSQYYIACQAPLDHTVTDFWRMIWEQNSRVIIMATDLSENGHEKCAEYLPPSVVLENRVSFGEFQVTLKSREVKEKYAVSTVHLKNNDTNTWRELTHLWYQWPDTGVPNDEATMVAMLLEARSYLKMALPEQIDDENSTERKPKVDDDNDDDIDDVAAGDETHVQATNGHVKLDMTNLDKTKSLQRFQGPLTVHCSPGTGRTGTIIACDIALRALEQPPRSVDIPQIVYFVRSGRASAVRTREQYEFIYKVANIYATKLTAPIGEN